jgi:hypothetical protein
MSIGFSCESVYILGPVKLVALHAIACTEPAAGRLSDGCAAPYPEAVHAFRRNILAEPFGAPVEFFTDETVATGGKPDN